jgi:hypothetical protein
MNEYWKKKVKEEEEEDEYNCKLKNHFLYIKKKIQ